MSKEVKRYTIYPQLKPEALAFLPDVVVDAKAYDALLAERDAMAKHLSSAIRYIYTGDMRDLNLTEALAALQGAQP